MSLLTSAFNASIILSLAPPALSTSALFLSKVHTDTRFPVTLCVAGWTFQSPTWNVGVKLGVGKFVELLFEVAVPEPTEGLDELDGPGVDDLLLELLVRDDPKPVGAPILYDCEIFVRLKKDDAAANIDAIVEEDG